MLALQNRARAACESPSETLSRNIADEERTLSEPSVLFTQLPASSGMIAVATLNAEKSLNSLTLEMVDALREQLTAWERDPDVICVVMTGRGDRAFCAGGDVVRLHQSATARDDHAAIFFEHEYRLDYQIHTYPKPVIVWGNGIVMGGGLGLLGGASHRVVTESTRMAMPEITIGLFPDVGGTYMLNRAPGRTGLFLALTGAAINAADALFAGLADRFIEHHRFDDVIKALQQLPSHPENIHSKISSLLRKFESESRPELPASTLREHFDFIQQVTDADDLDAMVAQITGYSGEDPWLKKAAQTLAAGCPTSMRLIEEQLHRGRHLSLKEIFQMELILACNCVRYPNFAEGVRALLIDKDRNPEFEPATLAAVDAALVEAHFTPPWQGRHPLSNL